MQPGDGHDSGDKVRRIQAGPQREGKSCWLGQQESSLIVVHVETPARFISCGLVKSSFINVVATARNRRFVITEEVRRKAGGDGGIRTLDTVTRMTL